MSTTCGATDAPCNCKQSRLLMDCLGFCKDDPVLSSFGNAQQGETQRWCNTAASATPGVASPTPSTSGGVAPTAGTTSTNPTAPAGTSTTPTNKPNSAGKVTLASGLVALTGLVALLI
ncbi:hypothetical protein K7432_008569 [Basidiobolus ranarum]|uniref:Uncharacterized protein n=1 Tax=Basidiobolus ranarum TaxID=34480 RepID=A0ABR2VYC5_9FUNG